jgi:protocatechuate 3,4-dioxygenase, beta subunit
MKTLILSLLTVLSLHCTRTPKLPAQNLAQADTAQIVGGGCESCELMYVGMPKDINAVDTSKGWAESGRKLVITGTVYKSDGQTPASDVILYYWQTDDNGLYSTADGINQNAKPHGRIRGWMKTGVNGVYALYTIRPAAYPGSQNPEHIHVVVKEPNLNEYYIDEFVFDNDPFLTPDIRKHHENRGGSGVLKTVDDGAVQTANHDIIVGQNVPDYPK